MIKDVQNKVLFQQVVILLQNARQQVLRTVNSTMNYTYLEFDRKIVEEEQNWKGSSQDGKQALKWPEVNQIMEHPKDINERRRRR